MEGTAVLVYWTVDTDRTLGLGVVAICLEQGGKLINQNKIFTKLSLKVNLLRHGLYQKT